MIEIKKDLTIKELFAELTTLKSKLIKLSHKYNRSMILVSAITYTDILTKGGKRWDDVMLNKTIQREEAKDEFDIIKEAYNSYKDLAVDKIREMINSKSVEECIVYFRDELKWSWKEISQLFNYNERHCRRLYKKVKEINQMS